MSKTTNAIGYFGVIVPTKRFWHGYLLLGAADRDARTLLGTLKRVTGGEYSTGSSIKTLCAGLIPLALDSDEHLDVVALALHKLTGFRHFYVIDEGHGAAIVDLPQATGSDDVQAVLKTHPAVIAARRSLWQDN